MKLSRETDYKKLKQDIRNDKKSLTDNFSHSWAMNKLRDFLKEVQWGATAKDGAMGTGTIYRNNGELVFNVVNFHLPRNAEHENKQAEQLKKDIDSIKNKFLCKADFETWINSLSYPSYSEFRGKV